MTRTPVQLSDSLESLIDHRGKTPKKLGGDWSPAGHRVVSAINIKDNRVDDNDHHYIDESLYEKWMATPLKAGDVLLTSEAPTGEVAYVACDVDWALGQRVFGLRGKPGLLDGRFLYYSLRGGPVRQQLMARSTGTTVSGIRQSELVKVTLDLPSIEEQRDIAGVLGALDDKIESAMQSVSVLGRLIAAEFRRVIGDEEVSVVPLGEVASVTKGVSYRSAELQPSRTALVTLKSFDRRGGYKPEGLKPYVGPYKPTQVIGPGELAVAQTDLTQGAEVVGRAVRVPADPSADVLVASLDLVIVRPGPRVTPEYLFGAVTDGAFRQHCRNRTSGTTVLHLASDAIPTYELPTVPMDVQERYSFAVRPMMDRIDSFEREIVGLSCLRDALLPELLSGRIRLQEIGVVA